MFTQRGVIFWEERCMSCGRDCNATTEQRLAAALVHCAESEYCKAVYAMREELWRGRIPLWRGAKKALRELVDSKTFDAIFCVATGIGTPARASCRPKITTHREWVKASRVLPFEALGRDREKVELAQFDDAYESIALLVCRKIAMNRVIASSADETLFCFEQEIKRLRGQEVSA